MDRHLEDLQRLDLNKHSSDGQKSYDTFLNKVSRPSDKPGSRPLSDRKLPDFFAGETFQIIIHNPTTFHQLLKFSKTRLCGENMDFLKDVDKYNLLLNDVANQILDIHRATSLRTPVARLTSPRAFSTKSITNSKMHSSQHYQKWSIFSPTFRETSRD
ncbi:hypothetical protein LTS17_011270 [Exophiala oligosperma]